MQKAAKPLRNQPSRQNLPKPFASKIARYPFHYRFRPSLESRRSLKAHQNLERPAHCHIRQSQERLKLKPNVSHVLTVMHLVLHVEQMLAFASLTFLVSDLLCVVVKHVLQIVFILNHTVRHVCLEHFLVSTALQIKDPSAKSY